MRPEDYVSGLLKPGTKYFKIGLTGMSSKDGFDLNYRILGSLFSDLKTMRVGAGYVGEERVFISSIIKINFLLALLTWITLYSMDYSLLEITAFVMINATLMPIFIKVVLDISYIYPDLETRQWHACEHKSAEFIERNLFGHADSSFESFQKCSPVHLYCGTVYMSLGTLWMLIIYPAIIIAILFTRELLMADLYTLSIAALLWLSAMLIIGLAIREIMSATLTKRRFILLIPVFIIPLLVERFFCLAEPTEDKLRISYEASVKAIKEVREEFELLTG